MAIRVNYVDGVYSEAALRGDKYRGRDVTALVKDIVTQFEVSVHPLYG